MSKKIILCDVDDVIVDLLSCWVNAINQKYGTNVNPTQITNWNISLFFPALTRKEIFAPFQEGKIWSNLERISGCSEMLEEINEKHNLQIVTATHYKNCDAKIERILELYPFLKWEQFTITQRKQLIHGDYLIDDGVHNVVGGDYQGILFSRPHNQSFNVHAAGIIRVSNWSEIRSIILS